MDIPSVDEGIEDDGYATAEEDEPFIRSSEVDVESGVKHSKISRVDAGSISDNNGNNSNDSRTDIARNTILEANLDGKSFEASPLASTKNKMNRVRNVLTTGGSWSSSDSNISDDSYEATNFQRETLSVGQGRPLIGTRNNVRVSPSSSPISSSPITSSSIIFHPMLAATSVPLQTARRHSTPNLRALEASAALHVTPLETVESANPNFTKKILGTKYDDANIWEWSFRESMCCEPDTTLLQGLTILFTLPILLVSFSITFFGKLLHDRFGQGLPVRSDETSWERKVRIQGVITTTGIMVIVIAVTSTTCVMKYFEMENRVDLRDVYIKTAATIVANINVIMANIIFINAMKHKWTQTTRYFIVGMWAITLSQLCMAAFDSWVLLTEEEYDLSTAIFWAIHLSETIYSALQCILYQTMWNYYDSNQRFGRPQALDDDDMISSVNVCMLTTTIWAVLLVGFRFTSISTFHKKHSIST